jgi:outer membrane protein TolC
MSRCFLALVVLGAMLFQLPESVLARPPAINPKTALEELDFGVPQFTYSPSARRVLAEISLRENQLLELGQWLSLDQAIELALINNPELSASYSTIEGQRWSVIAARRRWYPYLSVEPSRDSSLQFGASQRQNSTSAPIPGSTITSETNQSWNIQANLGWTFFDASRRPAIQGAIRDLNAQRLLFDVAARNLVLAVQVAYYRMQEQMRLVDQYKVITLLATLQLDLAIERQQQGRRLGNQIQQLRTTQRAEITNLIDAYVALFEYSVELSKLLALPGLSLVIPADAFDSPQPWLDPLDATVAHALAFREEIAVALQQSQAQSWRSSELLGAYWPRLDLLAVGKLDAFNNMSFVNGEASPNSQLNAGPGTVGIALNWSLYDGGIKAADAAKRRSEARTLALQADAARLQASAQVRQAYVRYVGSVLQVQNTTDAVSDSWSAFIGAIGLFHNNAIDATTLIQTQAQLVDALTAAAAAQRLRSTSVAELYRYSARWPPDVERLFEQKGAQFDRLRPGS